MLLSGRTIRPTTNSARCRTRRTKLKEHLLADGEKGYLDLESDLAKAKALRDSLDVERRVLDSEVESLKQRMRQRGPAAGVINDMIHGYLGHKELEIAASEDGYHFRRNGKPMEGSLSEGEKTAIALCYFLARVAAEGRKAFAADGIHAAFLGDLAAAIGKERVIVALDSKQGRIVVKGWREATRFRAEEVLAALEPYCAGFLCTYVDKEGMLQGTDLDWFRRLRAGTPLEITAAGGITTLEEVRALLAMNVH